MFLLSLRSQSSQTHFSLNRADANPMVWIVFLGARSENPNPDFNALDLSHFPLLCHLTNSTLRLRSFKSQQLSSPLLSSHCSLLVLSAMFTVQKGMWDTQEAGIYALKYSSDSEPEGCHTFVSVGDKIKHE